MQAYFRKLGELNNRGTVAMEFLFGPRAIPSRSEGCPRDAFTRVPDSLSNLRQSCPRSSANSLASARVFCRGGLVRYALPPQHRSHSSVARTVRPRFGRQELRGTIRLSEEGDSCRSNVHSSFHHPPTFPRKKTPPGPLSLSYREGLSNSGWTTKATAVANGSSLSG